MTNSQAPLGRDMGDSKCPVSFPRSRKESTLVLDRYDFGLKFLKLFMSAPNDETPMQALQLKVHLSSSHYQ